MTKQTKPPACHIINRISAVTEWLYKPSGQQDMRSIMSAMNYNPDAGSVAMLAFVFYHIINK